MAELRHDPLNGHWALMARSSDGSDRPDRRPPFPFDELRANTRESRLHRTAPPLARRDASCPFCPGNEHLTPPANFELAGAESRWLVRVFENKFPALREGAGGEQEAAGVAESVGPCGVPSRASPPARIPGRGIHEVVVDSARHDATLAVLPEVELASTLRVYRDRVGELGRRPGVAHVQLFKNHGRDAGASLEHIHTQILALPVVPPHVERMVRSARSYQASHGRCPLCDLVQAERSWGIRTVGTSGRFVALAPYASRVPYEIVLVPLGHEPRFERCADATLDDLAALAGRVFRALAGALGDPPYNLVLRTAPAGVGEDGFHWSLQIVPRLRAMTGFEWGSGCCVNPIGPEDAAARLREHMAPART